MILPSRRRFLFGAGALLAAPAIVRVASLMPVSAPKSTPGLGPWLTASDIQLYPGGVNWVPMPKAVLDAMMAIDRRMTPERLISRFQ